MSDYNDGILPEPCLRMDTHFGGEYESVEFGDGTGYIKAAPILAKVGALHEEIDRMRGESSFLRECIALNARDANAENDKLREERDMYRDLVGCMVHPDIPDQLQAENEKLRELVRIMHSELVSCEDNGYVCGGHKFDERVRKLGIEVDGCE